MREQELFRKFQESFRKWKGHFHILEQCVQMEEQMEYFKYSEKLRSTREWQELSETELTVLQNDLDNPEALISQKKHALALLASSHLVKAYRILEKYTETPDPILEGWAYMAFMEGRISLESELSDEKQILISTGMGGKGEKLRFYILILANGLKPFQDYQQKIVEREFPYWLEKSDCEIERLTVREQSVEMVLLTPILADIKAILERAISECNEYGNFLSHSFAMSNVKELTEEEVNEEIKKRWEKQSNKPLNME